MNQTIAMAFEPETVEIKIRDILSTKALPKSLKSHTKYMQIRSSIEEIGLVEPPVVTRMKGRAGRWLLLDGHVRVEICRLLKQKSVECQVALDDEAFTYNKRINRLAPVQEHKMILRAVERGVTPEKLAKTLNVNVKTIQQKYRLLDRICPEAEALLKDRMCPINTFEALKKMLPVRQIEAVDLMIAADNFAVSYSRALLEATPSHLRTDVKKPAKRKATRSQLAKMEDEVTTLQRDAKAVEEGYASDQLNLVLARAYISSLINNENVARFLSRHYPEIGAEFQEIASAAKSQRETTAKHFTY